LIIYDFRLTIFDLEAEPVIPAKAGIHDY
jgi:hypothetical protein